VRATWWRDEQDKVMDDRAGARWREAGPSMQGLVVCPQNHRRTVSWFGPKKQVRRPNTTETGSGRVGKLRSGGHVAGSHGLRREDAGCGEGIASSGVRGSRVIYHTGGTRYISHECEWMALSLRDLGFHFPPSISLFPRLFSPLFFTRLA
jgi:hypothetical protein